VLEPLAWIHPRRLLGFFYTHVMAGRYFAVGDDAAAYRSFSASKALLEDEGRLKRLPDGLREQFKGAVYGGLGTLAAFRDGDEASECAARIDALSISAVAQQAHLVRILMHAGRGEVELAEVHRRRLEASYAERGAVWRGDVTLVRHLSHFQYLAEDLLALRQSVDELEAMMEWVPALALEHRAVSASFVLCRGDVPVAIHELETLVREFPARRHFRWGPIRAQLAEAYLRADRPADARALCVETLSVLDDEDVRFIARYQELERVLARAEAALECTAGGAGRLDALLEPERAPKNPMMRSLLHRDRARIALAEGDASAFEEHLQAMSACARPTRNGALIAQVDRLGAQRARARGVEASVDFDGEPCTTEA
jgi:hypothetical protein